MSRKSLEHQRSNTGTALNNDDGEYKNNETFDVSNDACIGLSWFAYPNSAEVDGISCSMFIVQRAIDRVQQVIEFYQSKSLSYEAKLTQALKEEIISASYLSVNDFENATKHSELAEQYEIDAVTLIKPASTTLYGLPGT